MYLTQISQSDTLLSWATKPKIGVILVALVATAFSYFRETFLPRVIFIGVWLIAAVVWILVKVKD